MSEFQQLEDCSEPEELERKVRDEAGRGRVSARPQSGYRRETGQSSSGFGQFARFIKFHRIPIRIFWTKQKVNISELEFRQMLQEIDFPVNSDFDNALHSRLLVNGLVNLHYLCSFVPFWNARKEDTDELAHFLLKREQANKKAKTYFSSPKLSQSKDETEERRVQRKKRGLRPSFSVSRNFKEKQKRASKQIEESVQNRLSEIKYNMLVKAGQANEIVSRLGMGSRFQIVAKEEELQVLRNGLVLSQSNFRKECNQLTRLLRAKEKKKYWQVAESKKALRKLKVTEEKNNDVRDEQLKKVLIQTVKLTIDLKRQIELFEAKGINSVPYISLPAPGP